MQKVKLEFAVVVAVTLGLGAPALASGATRYAEPGKRPRTLRAGGPM